MPADLHVHSLIDQLFDAEAAAVAARTEASTWKARWQQERQRAVLLEATLHEKTYGHRSVLGDPLTCRDCRWRSPLLDPFAPPSPVVC